MFPEITHISDLTNKIVGYQEFGIYPNANGTTVVCYAIADKDTFRGENLEYKRECRGITFNDIGAIVCRPLHKFHNIGENEESMPHVIPWHKVVRVTTKQDGSMVTPLRIDGKIVMKTKRSFNCVEAVSANKWLHDRPEHLERVTRFIDNGQTPIFEWVSPESPIVLTHYKEPELILLQVRNNVTGEYLNFADESVKQEALPFRLTEDHTDHFRGDDGIVSWDKLKEASSTLTNEEGWVIQTEDGQFWKAKTDWYFALHHYVVFVRWRDLFVSARDGKLDDVRAAFVYGNRSVGVLDFIEDFIRKSLTIRKEAAVTLAQTIAKELETSSIGDVVKRFKGTKFFTEAMRINRNLIVDDGLRDAFFKEIMPKVSLSVVVSEQLSNWTYSEQEALAKAGFNDVPLNYLP